MFNGAIWQSELTWLKSGTKASHGLSEKKDIDGHVADLRLSG
jgi:hypothetical protein